MASSVLSNWVKKLGEQLTSGGSRRARRIRAEAAKRQAFKNARPNVETLEDRITPTTWTVTDPTGGAGSAGDVTLPYAVAQAASGDTINYNLSALPAGNYVTSLTATLALPNNVAIQGPGLAAAQTVAVDGGGALQLFNVTSSSSISGLTLQNGNHSFGGGIANSGNLTLTDCVVQNCTGLGQGGGIDNTGTLTMSGDTVQNCTSLYNGSVGSGGGIANSGTLNMSTTIVQNCTNTWNGAGVFNTGSMTSSSDSFLTNVAFTYGGGIANYGTLSSTNDLVHGNTTLIDGGGIANLGGSATVTNDVVTNNTASYGGGVYNTGSLSIDPSTFSGNHANWSGGGVNSQGGTLTVTSSSFYSNSSFYAGGGVAAWNASSDVTYSTFNNNTTGYFGAGALFNGGNATLNNDTIAFNTSTVDTGGGMYNGQFTSMTLTNCTIAYNSGVFYGGGIQDNGSCTLDNTIIADNTGASPDTWMGFAGGLSGSAPFITNYSWIGNSTTYSSAGGGVGNQIGAGDPGFAAGLAFNNGAPTQTLALATGSGAIGTGDPGQSTSNSGLLSQNLLVRGAGAVDMGAYQSVPVLAGPQTINSNSGIPTPLPDNSQTVTFTGTGFFTYTTFAANPSDFQVHFNLGVTGTITAATNTSITVDITNPPTSITSQSGIPLKASVLLTDPVTSNLYGMTPTAIDNVVNATWTVTNAAGSGGSLASVTFGYAGNHALSGDTIVFAPSTNGITQTLTHTANLGSHNLTIIGNGAGNTIISGGGTVEVLKNGGTTLIEDLTIENGNSGANNGGGIYNTGALTLTDDVISGNVAGTAFGNGYGGGVYSSGGSLTLDGDTINGNHADWSGGGVYSTGGALTVTSSSFYSNGSLYAGGGLTAWSATSDDITYSTFNNNTTGYFGAGAIFQYNSVTLNNDTFAYNDATVDASGGLYNGQFTSMTMTNCTVAFNTCVYYGGGMEQNGTCTIDNSIIADNTGSIGPDTWMGHGGGLSGAAPFVANYTWIGNSTDYSSSGGVGNQINAGDPGFFAGGLAFNNGAPTQTLALLSTSGARGVGDPSQATSISGIQSENLVNRPAGSVDLGAYQSPGLPTGTQTVSSNSGIPNPILDNALTITIKGTNFSSNTAFDQVHFGSGMKGTVVAASTTSLTVDITTPATALGTLTATVEVYSTALSSWTVPAITNVPVDNVINATWTVTNAAGAGGSLASVTFGYAATHALSGDTIVFAASTNGIVQTLTSTANMGNHSLTIIGNGAANTIISGGGTVEVLRNGGTTLIEGMTIEKGFTTTDGGGIYNSGSGNLTLTDDVISNNTASYGGGIYNLGTLTVDPSSIFGNHANWSGGGINSQGGTLTVSDTSFYSNSSFYAGGGLSAWSTTSDVTYSTFNNNTTGYFGAGALFQYATATLNNDTIAFNASTVDTGGGMYNGQFTSMTLTNCTIAYNSGVLYGGGIQDNGSCTLDNTIIADNTGASPDTWMGFGGGLSGSAPFITNYSWIGNSTTYSSAGGGVGNMIGAGDPGFAPALAFNGGAPTETLALAIGSTAANIGDPAQDTASTGLVAQNLLSRPANPAQGQPSMGAYQSPYYVQGNQTVSSNSGIPNPLPDDALSVVIKGTNFSANTAYDQVLFNNGMQGTVVHASTTSLTVDITTPSNALGTLTATVLVYNTGLAAWTLPVTLNVPVDNVVNATWTVTNAAGSGGSLASVTFGYAAQHTLTGDTIVFAPSTNGITQTLSSTANLGTKNLTIIGNGAANTLISGGNAVEVLKNGGTTLIEDLTIENGKTATDGGGVYNSGTLTLTNDVVSNSVASYGGGIYNTGNLTVDPSSIFGNHANWSGGGINSQGGSLTVSDTSFYSNSSFYAGGGLSAWSTTSVVDDSTFNNNTTGYFGAGALFQYATAALNNDTIAYNASTVDTGGGMYNGQFTSMTLTNCTIAYNSGILYGGGIQDNGSCTLDNTIIADNTGASPDTWMGFAGGLSGSAPFITDYSWIGNSTTYSSAGGGIGNMIGAGDPLFGSPSGLAFNNGAPTETLALTGASPARNIGDPAQATSVSGIQSQNLVNRVSGHVDMGAWQHTIAPPPSIVSVTPNENIAALYQPGYGFANSVQRSMMDSIVYTFSEGVNVGAGVFTISTTTFNGINGVVPTLNWAAVPGTSNTEWAVTFSGAGVTGGSIANGAYDLTISNAAGITAISDGQVCTVTAGTAPGVANQSLAGYAVANANYATQAFVRLFGDINGNEIVNAQDNAKFKLAIAAGGYNAAFDYDNNGSVNALDNAHFKASQAAGFNFVGFTQTI